MINKIIIPYIYGSVTSISECISATRHLGIALRTIIGTEPGMSVQQIFSRQSLSER